MTKKSIYFGTLLLTALALGSCASDDTATDKTAGKETPKTGTVFSSEDEPSTRTSATYTGSGLDFYWTANDKIWVKDDNNTYHKSSEDDIAARLAAVPGSTTTAKAKFWVNGTYTGSTHKVRYTGKNGASDKVIIKASQTQNTPNDAAHIAEDGDFGVADATGSGKYSFTLNHKAAYVTFMPYTAQGVIAGAKLQKIRIYTDNTSDQLAGTFDLADSGSLSNGVTTSNSVELKVKNFSIPNIPTYAMNAATIVIKPGTYSNLKIEYTLFDAETSVTGTITKTYPSVTFDAGKNTPVKTDLQVTVYPAIKFYMWDAQNNFWSGHEWGTGANVWQPSPYGRDNPNYPKPGDPLNRYYNNMKGYDDYTGLSPAVTPSSIHFQDLPNVNELLWYAKKGDPHWDNNVLWATMGHLYKSGMWLLKSSKIPNFDKNHAPDETVDYTKSTTIASYVAPTGYVKSGQPSNIGDYFFLPSFGETTYNGYWRNAMIEGSYWSKTPIPSGFNNSYRINLRKTDISVYSDYRNVAKPLFRSSFEDEYRPIGL